MTSETVRPIPPPDYPRGCPGADESGIRKLTGVVIIIMAPDGRVVCSETDVHQGGVPEGYTLTQAQEERAKRAAWRKVIYATCNPDMARIIVDCIPIYQLRSRLHTLGWRVHVESIEADVDTLQP